MTAPAIGATTGIQLYAQSELPLLRDANRVLFACIR